MSEKNNVKIENLPGSEVRITVLIPSADFSKYIEQAAEELSREMKIDGFRSGKVPLQVVERNVGSQKLLYEGAERAIRKAYVDAVLDNKIEAIGQPKVTIKKIAKGNDFEFEAVAAVMPKIEVEDYQEAIGKINKNYSQKKIEAKEEEIERELNFLAKQRAKIITVNRKAAKNDQVEVDFEVSRGAVPIEGGIAKKHLLIIGEGKFIPGFEDNLIGMEAGQEKDFELSFPKDYHQKNLAGEKAKFKVKLNLVQERQIPKINDEFSKGIGKFENLSQLKENIKQGIEHEMLHKQQDKQKKEVLDFLVKKSQAEIPQILVDSELSKMIDELDRDISSIGLDRQTYFSQVGTTEEKLKEEWKKEAAPNRIKAALLLRKIARDEKLDPNSKEIEERMNTVLQYYKKIEDAKDKVNLENLYEAIKGELINEKALEYLTNIKH
jgi:trigger factor